MIRNNLIVPRFALPALLLSSLWMSQAVHAQQSQNPFEQAAKAREEANKAREKEIKLGEEARRRAEEARRTPQAGSLRPAKIPGPNSEHVFDKASNERDSSRQRAFDRGQSTALPAQEERESLGRLPGVANNAVRAENGTVVNQGAPAAAVYNRVMETQRFFSHYQDPYLWNANDVFTDKPEDRKMYDAEADRLYPDVLSPQSAFTLRHTAINRWIDSRQPPLARDARRKLLVAHMVSLELTGKVRRDKFGLGQIPVLHMIGQRPPAFIKRNNFEVEVRDDEVKLPDGLRGTVLRGKDGRPDIIEWLDAEGSHVIHIPQEEQGKLRLFKDYDCDYRRLKLQNDNFRVIFSKPK